MLSFAALLVALSSPPQAAPVPGPAAATICPVVRGTALVDPPAISSSNGVLALTLDLKSEVRGGATLLCWVYQVRTGGKVTTLSTPPTLNVKQGERLVITLINDLTFFNVNSPTPPPIVVISDAMRGAQMSNASSATANPYALMCGQPQLIPTPTPNPVTGRIYGYHRSPWNEANLHFHGLNTSPQQPGDNTVSVLLCPHALTAVPNAYRYVVDIPANEPPGTYWYHPHAHGESLYQIFLGLTGVIVVHPATPSVPDQLTNHIAIVRDQPAHQGVAEAPMRKLIRSRLPDLAQIRTELAQGIPDITRRPGGDPFQPPQPCPANSPIPFNTENLSVNGVPLPLNGNGIFGLPASTIGLGETQYWRLANTNAQTALDIVLLVNGKPTPLMVTSRDGVPLVTKNGQPTWQPVAMGHVVLMPAARMEFYLTGSVAGATMVLRTLAVDTGCIGDTDLARNLFLVVVGSTAVSQHVTMPAAYRAQPQRFSNLGQQAPAKQRVFVLTEYSRSDEPEPDFYITETSNPKAVEHPYAMEGPPDVIVKDGTVEDWTILNYTNEIHAFHIHQIHFLPLAGVDLSQGLGQLLDTVYVPQGLFNAQNQLVPGQVKLRMDFREKNIIGTFVYHCHIMEHEDNGMMAKIQVIP